jgi:hypothetical protein
MNKMNYYWTAWVIIYSLPFKTCETLPEINKEKKKESFLARKNSSSLHQNFLSIFICLSSSIHQIQLKVLNLRERPTPPLEELA